MSPWHFRAMVEAGTEECSVNKDCPKGRFCDVHTCRVCVHENAACHFIGENMSAHVKLSYHDATMTNGPLSYDHADNFS